MTNDRTGNTSHGSANFPVVLSIDQIINLLSSKDVSCEPKQIARYILERTSLHRLNAYLHAIEEFGTFDNYTLKSIYDLMTLDKGMSDIALKYIGVFETQMKARYSQIMGEKYGAFAFYDEKLFLRKDRFFDTLGRAQREIDLQVKKGNLHLKSLKSEYNGRVPLWHFVEYISFGSLSMLFSNTADREVTSETSLFFNSNKIRLSSWLKTINNVRNVCAHFSPYIIRKQIPSPPKKDPDLTASPTSPFYIFPMLRTLLLSSEPFMVDDAFLNYPKRLHDEVYDEIHSFLNCYPGFGEWVSSSGILDS